MPFIWRILFAYWLALVCRGLLFFKSYICGVCGYNRKDRKRKTEVVPLLSYDKDINNHKFTNKLTESS